MEAPVRPYEQACYGFIGQFWPRDRQTDTHKLVLLLFLFANFGQSVPTPPPVLLLLLLVRHGCVPPLSSRRICFCLRARICSLARPPRDDLHDVVRIVAYHSNCCNFQVTSRLLLMLLHTDASRLFAPILHCQLGATRRPKPVRSSIRSHPTEGRERE